MRILGAVEGPGGAQELWGCAGCSSRRIWELRGSALSPGQDLISVLESSSFPPPGRWKTKPQRSGRVPGAAGLGFMARAGLCCQGWALLRGLGSIKPIFQLRTEPDSSQTRPWVRLSRSRVPGLEEGWLRACEGSGALLCCKQRRAGLAAPPRCLRALTHSNSKTPSCLSANSKKTLRLLAAV